VSMKDMEKTAIEQLKDDEIRIIVQEAIAACGDNVNMGNVMKHVMPKTKGRADGKVVNNIVKELLG
ncbi:GatB/YqeY domain-containing protein, partial [uncultured Veillonella sp.]|uniref:GatB/YqeY domain-containing protein n=1 Tax=uncultured Veillonella sp. TaxID=159268 RepID=UPI00320A0FDA